MKKIMLAFFIFNSAICLDMAVIPTAIVMVTEEIQKIDKISSDSKTMENKESIQSKCPLGSSTKVKVALISASATVISAIIFLIIHLTK